jgi:predicted Rossmann fold flavoprotein
VAQQNPDIKVLILEKQGKVLQKLKVSGGGRCNVTHACTELSALVKRYPRGKNFIKKTFSRFAPADTMQWFEERGVALKIESDNRVFPKSDSSQSVIDCLLNEASRLHVDVRLHAEVMRIEQKATQFHIHLKQGEVIIADMIYAAPGGFPKPEQYHWVEALGHTIETPVPSLFTFNIPDKKLHDRMGLVAEQAIVKIESSKLSEQGAVLITHWGLSGPAILKLSAWGARELSEKQYRFSILVNWLGVPESVLRQRWQSIRDAQGALTMGSKNPFMLSARLWEYLLDAAEVDSQLKWSELPSKAQHKLIHTLTTQRLMVEGKTTFKEEFVTCGGIRLDEIEPSTMESKRIPNFYLGGEWIDVDGITGGFNFQHAWTSAFIAASAICTK